MFSHEALLYDGLDGLLSGTVPFLREGIEAGEPILVATAVQHGITSALDPRLTAIATRGEPV